MSGWVRLYRSIDEWEWASNPNVLCVFIRLLVLASFEPRQWNGISIEKGQVVISLENLAKKVGLSVQQTRTALNKLKSTNEITSQSTNKYSVITIVNYGKYQGIEEENNKQDNKQSNNPITNEQQTNNKQITTSKESKEVNNLNNIYNINNSPLPSLNDGLTPREKGTNPRAEGTNPRAMGTNPRVEASKEPSEKYAFEGKFVKLNEKDFNRWKKAFPNVELEGFLTSYDAWLKNQPEKVQKEWYMRCSGYLAKKNQENAKNKPAQKSEETIWELYERMGIPHKKPEIK